jgi:hypothetical protein
MCQLPDKHALRNVVSFLTHYPVRVLVLSAVTLSHASIDPATRAARGLPEDLIRLCVGIEDAEDLVDDLERALFQAGAIMLSADRLFIRPNIPEAITRAVEKLAITDSMPALGRKETQELLVSAPGKVILFGEHAVVHGVVSLLIRIGMDALLNSRRLH